MSLFQHNWRAWLVPYVEETLDARRAALLAAHLARDPRLAAEAEALRATAARLRQSAQTYPSSADPRLTLHPSPLWPGIAARLTRPQSLTRPQGLRKTRYAWAAAVCAASLTLTALLLHGPGAPPSLPPAPVSLPVSVASATVGRGRVKHRHSHGHVRPKATLLAAHFVHSKPSRLAAAKPAAGSGTDALPAPPPVPVPAVRPAVSLSDGAPQFRLASPVRPAPEAAAPAPAPRRTRPAVPSPEKPPASPPPPSV